MSAEPAPYPLFYSDPAAFVAALKKSEATVTPLTARVTGVTVPHHLLALDLITDTLRLAQAGTYERILLLSPDHFKRGTTAFSTTGRDFLTPLGKVAVDRTAVASLLTCPKVSESNLFSHEHGVQALLPAVARCFPGVPLVPVALGVRSTPGEWAALLPHLEKLAREKPTLIIQSTDFSHYLSQPVAMRRDAETLRMLTRADPEGVTPLDQPGHLDSKAAQWLMMQLQRRLYNASPVVVQNRNAIHHGGHPREPSTTSYITQVYSPEAIPGSALPGERWCFAGDAHFGRAMAARLADATHAARIEKAILEATGGAPLILNLEGVMMPAPPARPRHPFQIAMAETLTLEWLRRLHVKVVSLANNHSGDFGPQARASMKSRLEQIGIVALEDGEVHDLGRFRLGVATDVENNPRPAKDMLTPSSFAGWQAPPEVSAKPLFAFLHCGVEYARAPALRERLLAGWAEARGASLILGAHPHRPSPRWDAGPGSLRWFSLGNFLFDQTDPLNTGGIVEVRFLDQGTWTARWLPLGNLFAPLPQD